MSAIAGLLMMTFMAAASSPGGGGGICQTIPGTSIQVGQGCFPRSSCPAETFSHDPVAFGAVPGGGDASGAISQAIAAGVAQGGNGDIFFGTPGTYLVNLTTSGTYVNAIGLEPPNGAKVECAAGVTLLQTLQSTTPTAMITYNGTNGATVCGCDFKGAQTAATGPYTIIQNNNSAIQVYNQASNIEIEGNTFHHCTGNTCIQTPVSGAPGNIIGATNLDISFNTFSLSPYYCTNLDGQMVSMNVHNNLGTDCVFGVEWDACPTGTSAGNSHIYNNAIYTQFGSCNIPSGSACAPPGYSSGSNGSGTTCNYSGVTVGGSNASFANYCNGSGTSTHPAFYNFGGTSGLATFGPMTNNIVGPNCTCSNTGGVC